jgi:hypothetical protein
MSDNKPHQFRPPLYQSDARESSRDDDGREQEGWDAYRKWLKSMSGKQRSRRAPIDHSVYSWKGYQSWADRIRQSWDPDDS